MTLSKTINKILLIVFLIIVFVLIYFLFFSASSATNYKIAYIIKEQNHFKVTVKGKRSYMVHDIISLFKNKFYEDSTEFIIPRSNGIINGEELPNKPGYYKLVGTITIQNNEMKINLFIDNYDDKRLESDSWNGRYKLIGQTK